MVSFETVKNICSNLWQFALLCIVIIAFLGDPASASAEIKSSRSAFPPLSPAEILASINNYRNQNGLLSLQTNTTLTILAQGHAEYQASINTITHTGPGGSTAKGRAISAGYAGGNVSYYAEIIYGGTNATPSMAINWWKGSSIHNSMMLAPAFNEFGAGVASDGSWNYYTVEFGYSSGAGPSSSSNNSGSSSSSGSDGDDAPSAPSIIYAVPVVKATPREDGSVIHVLKTGQVPWTIASVYDVDLDTLLEQNGLTRYTYVYTGDELIVVPSNTPAPETPTPPFTPTPNITPSPSITPTNEFTSTVEPIATLETTPDVSDKISDKSNEDNDQNNAIRWTVITAFAIFILVIFRSMFTPKSKINIDDKSEFNHD